MGNFSEYLLNGIAKKDIQAIRGALNGYIDSDPAFKTTKFDDAAAYAEQKGIKVFEELDEDFPVPGGTANEDLFFELRAGLQENYAKERIAALKRVGRACMNNAKVYAETGITNASEKAEKASVYGKKPLNRSADKTREEDTSRRLKKAFHQHRLAVIAIAAAIVLVGIFLIAAGGIKWIY